MFKQSPFVGPGTETATVHAFEMIIMLVIAFALGYLLSRFMTVKDRIKLAALERNVQKLSTDNVDLSTKLGALGQESEKLKDQLATSELEKVELKEIVSDLVTSYESAPADSIPVLTVQTATTVSEKDDLKKIEGIGPKIEAILQKEGISTFAQLADAEETTLKEMLLRQGERFRVHKPKTWPQQAALARDGNWDQLKALQDELRGGREK